MMEDSAAIEMDLTTFARRQLKVDGDTDEWHHDETKDPQKPRSSRRCCLIGIPLLLLIVLVLASAIGLSVWMVHEKKQKTPKETAATVDDNNADAVTKTVSPSARPTAAEISPPSPTVMPTASPSDDGDNNVDDQDKTAKLWPRQGRAGDQFGQALAVDQHHHHHHRLLIGAWHDATQGVGSGSAYVLDWDETRRQWVETAQLLPSDGTTGDAFGVAVALYGDTAVIGAYLDDTNLGGTDAGSVYVFEFKQPQEEQEPVGWIETTKLVASDGDVEHQFGTAVAMNAETIVVGAIRAGALGGGKAYVFERQQQQENEWIETAQLVPNDSAAGDFFGVALRLRRIDQQEAAPVVVVVGAHLASTEQGAFTGAAYVFQRHALTAAADADAHDETPQAWRQTAKLVGSDTAFHDSFGFALDVFGNTIVVGAFSKTLGEDLVQVGSAYVFSWRESTEEWEETAILAPPRDIAQASYDNFGVSVAAYNHSIVVGMQRSNHQDADGRAGMAFLFQWDSRQERWVDTKRVMNTNVTGEDRFGAAVSLYDNTLLVGAFLDRTINGEASGSVLVFDLSHLESPF